MAKPSPPLSLAIVGSGIGGLALAIGLLKVGVPCTVYEGAARFDAIGAGIGLGPNSMKAIELMDERFAQLYDEVKVGNKAPEKIHEQIEILGAEEGFGALTGWTGGSVGHPDFTRSSAHRKALLDIMKSLIPEGTVKFNKRVVSLNQEGSTKVEIEFGDGERIKVDAVIGCDGIKGMTRREVLESRFPEEVLAKYCNEYVYRAITSMENAKGILGTHAENAKWFMMESKGVAMYPISKGAELNVVVFVEDKKPWQGEQVATEVTRKAMMADLEGFDKRLLKLMDYAKPMKWPLFHHPDTPTYYKGRICLLGDSAHASSPSQAAGAGQGLEDALILSKLLGLVNSPDELDVAFQVYDSIRRPRAQRIVQESKVVGEGYFLTHPKFGHDLQKVTDDANERLPKIWWHDLAADLKAAELDFKRLVGTPVKDEAQKGEVELEKSKKKSHCIIS